MANLLCLGLFAFLIVAGVRLSALDESSLSPEEQWEAFKTKFNRTYSNQTEHGRRKQIFFKNLAEIEQHNAKYDLSNPNAPHFRLSLNEFCKFLLIIISQLINKLVIVNDSLILSN